MSWLLFFWFESLARLGHWMFALGIQCISEGVRDLCGPCELVWVVWNINHLESRMPVRDGNPVYT